MDLPLEPALTAVGGPLEPPGRMAGRSLEEWNAAYAKVESYFHALRVRNRVLLGRLVIHVLKRAMRRAPEELERSATELAAEEMDHVVTEWFAELLHEPPTGTDQMLSTRGRLALAARRHARQMAGPIFASPRPLAAGICDCDAPRVFAGGP